VTGVTILADERKRIASLDGNQWTYIGLMVVPSARLDDLYSDIMSRREKVGHGFPMKFSEVKKASGEKYELALSFVNGFIEDGRRAGGKHFFYLFGVNHSRMNYPSFGGTQDSTDTYCMMYHRFFRTAVIGGLKYFLGKEHRPIVVDAAYHDSEGNLEEHSLFKWHILRQAALDEAFEVRCDQIEFVSSDHRKERANSVERLCASHVLQYADVILGAMSHCLDYRHPNPGKDGVARQVAPLLSRMVNCPLNRHSSYGHYRKYCVGFFPDSKGQIFHRRTLPIEQPQLSFDGGPRGPDPD
jgi:hypothetical protein